MSENGGNFGLKSNMPTGRVCGNCFYFVRIKKYGNGRNGICDKTDYNCRSDGSYAKKCKFYKSKKYKRERECII